MTRRVAISFALFALACTEQTARHAPEQVGGTLVIATTQDPRNLFPPAMVTTQAKQITEQIYDYLADVGPGLDTRNEKSFRPQLADRWNWSTDSLMLFFHINPEAKWHDGKDVTAKDVQFTFNLNKNPAVGSRIESDLANIDSVTVADSLTPVFWFHRRSPTQFLDATSQMLILPAHQLERIPLTRLRETAPSPIGSGRFRLGRWDKGASVQIVSDTSNYRGRAKLDRVIWSVSLDVTAAVTTLLSGSTDIFDGLRPENLSDVARLEWIAGHEQQILGHRRVLLRNLGANHAPLDRNVKEVESAS